MAAKLAEIPGLASKLTRIRPKSPDQAKRPANPLALQKDGLSASSGRSGGFCCLRVVLAVENLAVVGGSTLDPFHSASCILAHVANDLHRTLARDPATHQVTGDDEANRLLARPYRTPWQHPAA